MNEWLRKQDRPQIWELREESGRRQKDLVINDFVINPWRYYCQAQDPPLPTAEHCRETVCIRFKPSRPQDP